MKQRDICTSCIVHVVDDSAAVRRALVAMVTTLNRLDDIKFTVRVSLRKNVFLQKLHQHDYIYIYIYLVLTECSLCAVYDVVNIYVTNINVWAKIT